MEHLEGETLQDRLKKGALALDQALRYAIQIADALDAAHRNGITHRDLKPGNIFLTTSGAKLIDFGLAKLRQPRAAGEHATTLAGSLTAPGTIIGTLLYMAPEQLEGQKADARSDIWAFGCVLYEMVTGRRAFEGKSQTSVLAAIIEREPTPMPSVEPMTPAGLDYVVTTSLAKAPDDRWQTARDLLRELRRVAAGGAVPTASARPITPQSLALWQRPLALLAVVAVAVLVTGLAVWSVTRPDGSTSSALRRFALDVGMSQPITLAGVRAMPVLSPDGSQLVYAANITGTPQLYWRSLDQLEAQPLAETDNAHDPFFSLDGDWVGFIDPAAGELKKVSLRGGSSRSLCECAFLGGGTWLGDGTIIFAHGVPGRSVLSRVSEAGGTPEPLTTLDAERGRAPMSGHTRYLAGRRWCLRSFPFQGTRAPREVKALASRCCRWRRATGMSSSRMDTTLATSRPAI